MPAAVLSEARRLRAAGLAIIPILCDGSKAPAIKWGDYTKRQPTYAEVDRWFAGNVGIGIIGGAVSGNLEQLDLDEPGLDELFEQAAADQGPEMLAIVMRLVKVRTPRPGTHYRYRLQQAPDGNRTLAKDADGNKLIETKAEGGYALAPGSPPSCHPENKRYELIRGDLAELPVLTPQEHSAVLWLAREFNRYEQPQGNAYTAEYVRRPRGSEQKLRAGDDYNERADVLPLLLSHGWEVTHQSGDTIYLRRPGKSKGHSATLRNGIFTLFTSSTPPFEPWEDKKQRTGSAGYSSFAVYSMLEHGGDFKVAATALYRDGYGEQSDPGDYADLLAIQQEARKKKADATSDAEPDNATVAADLPPIDEITTAEQWRHWWGQAWQRKRDHETADKLVLGHLYIMQVADLLHGQKTEWIKQYLFDPEGYILPQIRNWASISKAYPELTARAWRGESLWQNGDRPKTWDGLRVLAPREKDVRNEYLKKRMSVPQMQRELREKGIIGPKPALEPRGWRACEASGLPTKVANILSEESRKDGAAVVIAKVETIFGRRKAGDEYEHFEDPERERLAAENRYLKAQLAAAQHDIAELQQQVETLKAERSPVIESPIQQCDEAPPSFFTGPVKNEEVDAELSPEDTSDPFLEEPQPNFTGPVKFEPQTEEAGFCQDQPDAKLRLVSMEEIDDGRMLSPSDPWAMYATLFPNGIVEYGALYVNISSRFNVPLEDVPRVIEDLEKSGRLRRAQGQSGKICYEWKMPVTSGGLG